MTKTYACHNCSTPIDHDVDCFSISDITGHTYCEDCRIQDLRDASTVLVITPDRGEPDRVLVGDAFIENQYGDPYADLPINRAYKATDGWRGYYETTIDGWTEIVSGWTTQNWGDGISDRKQLFNEWAQSIASGDEDSPRPPVTVAIICDPTSNVFSTAIGVHVADSDVETFTTWLGDVFDTLALALS